MGVVDQWRAIEQGLPEGWGDARLRLIVEDERYSDRAAALLGPMNPGRRGKTISFQTARRGASPRPDLVRRLLARLDAEGIKGRLELMGAGDPPAEEPARPRPTLVEQWERELAALPDDWSDLYGEVELVSSDYLERAALLLAPVNPARFGGPPAFRFRVARGFGYGASAGMARRCLERLDDEGIRGTVRVLFALSDSRPVATQGPVWYRGGRVV